MSTTMRRVEIEETRVPDLPSASLEMLKQMREESCSSASFAFKLLPQQRFLRRVLSPDSPSQNVLVVHGVGQGKSCSAIQIAEEYIIRPEFQDKKVLVMANPSIQENFKNQIFDISRVNTDDGILTSKQCSGRRYLDILQRGQRQPLQVSTRADQEALRVKASRLISEFYEFVGYGGFANELDRQGLHLTPNDVDTWIHATYDNRLIIVDEAHNLRETTETGVDAKLVSAALKRVIQTAQNITLVLLTATPMYDRFDEIFDSFNLFLWNSRKQSPAESLKSSDFFTASGEFVSKDAETTFRSLCETYVSFIRGENPFTFPFRLPPPDSLVAKNDRTLDAGGHKIDHPRRYLTLTKSTLSDFQAEIVRKLSVRGFSEPKIICTFPDDKPMTEVLEKREGQYFYTDEEFLAPSQVATYSSKFALVADILSKSTGLAFVYSNLAEQGVQLFAMCLEEHGFRPAYGDALLGNPSSETTKQQGNYALITSRSTDADISRLLTRLRRPENRNGEDIRVVLASPKVSEGVDFRYIRQIHILDPWFNMSRIEQVIGRGMRVCSHSILPFEDQNTTIYLHVGRYSDGTQECVDETIYRDIVERKAIAIAKVKKVIMESAMDCSLEYAVNNLPAEWKSLRVPQRRNQDGETLTLPISVMASPAFIDESSFTCQAPETEVDTSRARPLSSILDVRDEILDKLLVMFKRKPVWTLKEFYKSPELKQYDSDVVSYLVQHLIESHTILKDAHGRIGHLETTKSLISFAIHPNETLQDKLLPAKVSNPVQIESDIPATEAETQNTPTIDISAYTWPTYANAFSDDVKRGYYVDHVLSHDEKVKYLRESTDPSKLLIMSPTEIYNSEGEKITPIGKEVDEVHAWKQALKEKYIAQKDLFFVALKEADRRLIFNVDEKSLPLKRVERSKGIGGRACGSYTIGILNAFMEWLGGGFPAEVKTKDDRCMYLNLRVRQAILDKKDGLVWYTPEEWAMLESMKTELK